MPIQLLDASLAGLAELILICMLLGVTLIEAFVLLVIKFNSIGKCFLDSFLVNLVSLGIGWLVSNFIFPIGLNTENYTGLLLGYLISVGMEGIGLQLLNKKKPVKKVWQASLIMNAVTYAILAVIISL